MTLTVETGTGSATADAFVAVATVDTYATSYGHAAWAASADTAAKEAAIRRGTAYISDNFDWNGHRVNLRNQALAWPRWGVLDSEGLPVASSSVPVEVTRATCEAAIREFATPGSLNPDIKAGGGIVKRVKAGSVEVEYASNTSTYASFQRIQDMLAPLTGRVSSLFGTSARG